MNRRRVMRALGLSALVAPHAAQGMGARLGRGLVGDTWDTDILDESRNHPSGGRNDSVGPRLSFRDAARRVFDDRRMRARAESALYDQHRVVKALDPDLAVNRSMSLAAKITFQRQRNVARAMAELQADEVNVFDLIHDAISKGVG